MIGVQDHIRAIWNRQRYSHGDLRGNAILVGVGFAAAVRAYALMWRSQSVIRSSESPATLATACFTPSGKSESRGKENKNCCFFPLNSHSFNDLCASISSWA